jgi:hypothetical protein
MKRQRVRERKIVKTERERDLSSLDSFLPEAPSFLSSVELLGSQVMGCQNRCLKLNLENDGKVNFGRQK